MYLRLSFLVEVQRPAAFQSGQCSSLTLLFLWAGQGSSLAAFRQGSAAFRSFSGQQASWRCQVGGRHLPTVSYGPFQTKLPVISEYTIFAHLDRLVSLHFVPGRRSSNSCSAAVMFLFLCYLCFLCYTNNSLFVSKNLREAALPFKIGYS